jgi:hypothetical protein
MPSLVVFDLVILYSHFTLICLSSFRTESVNGPFAGVIILAILPVIGGGHLLHLGLETINESVCTCQAVIGPVKKEQ